MTRLSRAIAALVCLLGITAPAAASAQKKKSAPGPADIYPLSKVKAGQRGYGLTVFRGVEPERFEFEVIGIARNFLPKMDIILVRSSDPRILEVGFARGMSGSPLFIDGKVACAFSYGFPFAKTEIGGCTPIEYMIADAQRPVRGPDASAVASRDEWQRHDPMRQLVASADEATAGLGSWVSSNPLPRRPRAEGTGEPGKMVQASLPLSVSGLGTSAFEEARALFEPYGVVPMQGGGGSGDPDRGPKGFALGAPVGAVLARGDVSMVATGTVSFVQGERVSAFGHPFFQFGEIYMPAVVAEIHAIVPSYNMAFKLSSPLREIGSMIQDRQASITVDTATKTPMVPVEIRVTGPGGSETFNSDILSNRYLTPSLVGLVLASAAQLIAPDISDVTAEMVSTLVIEGYEPIVFRDYMHSANGVGKAMSSVRALKVLVPILFNPWEPVRVKKLTIDMKVAYEPSYLSIEEVRVPNLVLPYGRDAYVDVVLRAYGKQPFVKRVAIRIPERLAGHTVKLEIGPADSIPFESAPPESLEDSASMVRRTYPGNILAVSITTPNEGVTLSGRVVPNLPDSALDTAHYGATTLDGGAWRSVIRTFLPMPHVVKGLKTLVLRIEEPRPPRP